MIGFLPTVPLSKPTLKVSPGLAQVNEGDNLRLICSVEGSPPVTFKWYRSDKEIPLQVETTYMNSIDYQIPVLSSKDSGRYRCEAINPANSVHSDLTYIEGKKMGL